MDKLSQVGPQNIEYDHEDYRADCLIQLSVEGLIKVFDEQLKECEKDLLFNQKKTDSLKKILEKLKS